MTVFSKKITSCYFQFYSRKDITFLSRSSRINLEAAEKVQKMEVELSQLREELSAKEKDFDSTLDVYKQDISVLECEKKQLTNQRQKLLQQNKTNVFERLGVTPGKTALSPGLIFFIFKVQFLTSTKSDLIWKALSGRRSTSIIFVIIRK